MKRDRRYAIGDKRGGAAVYLNGRWLARDRARVSVFDRGFLYGDGIFETLRAYRAMPYALDAHVERLQESAGILALTVPNIDWHARCAELLRRNRLLRDDARIRIVLTCGESPPGLLPGAGTQFGRTRKGHRRQAPGAAEDLSRSPSKVVAALGSVYATTQSYTSVRGDSCAPTS